MPCDKHIGNFIGDFSVLVLLFGFLGPSGMAWGRARTKTVGPRTTPSILSTVWSTRSLLGRLGRWCRKIEVDFVANVYEALRYLWASSNRLSSNRLLLPLSWWTFQVDSWDSASVTTSRQDSNTVWRSADVDAAWRKSIVRPYQRQE